MEDLLYEGFQDISDKLKTYTGSNLNFKKHFHRRIELQYVLSGEIKAVINKEEYIAKQDEIIFVHSYYTHSFSTPESNQYLNLIVPAEITNDFVGMITNRTFASILTDAEFNRTYILPIFKTLFGLYKTSPRLVNQGFINVIFGYMLDHYPTVPIDQKSPLNIIIETLKYIDIHYNEKVTIALLASNVSYNKFYFSKFFNKYVEIGFNNYLNAVRIKNLIIMHRNDPQATMTKLAYACGFDSLITFYRSFKKLFNTTPKQYFRQ